jgi:hypothetical protein
MALRTIVAEVPHHVVRIRCLLEVRRMTLVTIRVMQLVVPVHVARLAWRCCMSACQREERCVMVECRRTPPCC